MGRPAHVAHWPAYALSLPPPPGRTPLQGRDRVAEVPFPVEWNARPSLLAKWQAVLDKRGLKGFRLEGPPLACEEIAKRGALSRHWGVGRAPASNALDPQTSGIAERIWIARSDSAVLLIRCGHRPLNHGGTVSSRSSQPKDHVAALAGPSHRHPITAGGHSHS
jgi:hypothetical protein